MATATNPSGGDERALPVALAMAPAGLLLLFVGWSGSAAHLGGDAALVGHLALGAFALLGIRAWRDPLNLGPRGVAFWWAWLLALAVATITSPVPRAGLGGLLSLPVFALVPAAVARCWQDRRRRRLGLRSIAAVVTIVASWALVAWWRHDSARPAMPLGHHNLLATWLIATLPLTVTARRLGSPRLGAVATFVAIATLVATRSLGGLLAFGVLLVASAGRSRHRRRLSIGLLVLCAVAAPRVVRIVAGQDASAGARAVYAEAGIDGWRARPVLGWGLGSTGWTIAPFLRPQPRVSPAGEIVADLHSLPLTLAYETGTLGLVLSALLVAAFARARRRSSSTAPGVARAGMLGLLAWGVATLLGLPWTAPALPLTLAMLAGVAMTGSATVGPLPGRVRREPTSVARVATTAVAALVVLALAVVLRWDLAHRAYDQARQAAAVEDVRVALVRARAWDPRHPLYRFHDAWVRDDAEGLRAAAASIELAAFSIAAARRAPDPGRWLDRACAQDPFSALAAFERATKVRDARERPDRRVDAAARALIAEPRLLAAEAWISAPELLVAAVERVRTLDALDQGWRVAFDDTAATISAAMVTGESTETLVLVSTYDARAATAPSRFVFRRVPWPRDLIEVRLQADLLARIDLPPVTTLASTPASYFSAPDCGLPPRKR